MRRATAFLAGCLLALVVPQAGASPGASPARFDAALPHPVPTLELGVRVRLASDRRIIVIPLLPPVSVAPPHVPMPSYIPPSREHATAEEDALSHAEVAELQRGLNALGFAAGPADGIVGPKTRQAIARFEAERGETPSGRANFAILQAVRSALRP